MTTFQPPHDLLRQFEHVFRESDLSAYKFITESSAEIGHDLQLDLIAIEIEMLLKRGELPDPNQLVKDFPHLGQRVNKVFADMLTDFAEHHCPVEETFRDAPRVLGGYKIIREIGRGGMGVVYEAIHVALDRKVALKIPFFATSEITTEAKALAALDHPNICKLYDVGSGNGLLYMAMEFVGGRPLADLFQMPIHLSTEQAVALIRSLASAMQVAHQQSVVHLDITPTNIMLRDGMTPVLMDFGLARQGYGNMNQMDRGSPAYCAPEQLLGDLSGLFAACDIYSLGAVFWELLSGERIGSYAKKSSAESDGGFSSLHSTDPVQSGVDPELQKICAQATARNPLARYRSMGEFSEALRIWQDARKQGPPPSRDSNRSTAAQTAISMARTIPEQPDENSAESSRQSITRLFGALGWNATPSTRTNRHSFAKLWLTTVLMFVGLSFANLWLQQASPTPSPLSPADAPKHIPATLEADEMAVTDDQRVPDIQEAATE